MEAGGLDWGLGLGAKDGGTRVWGARARAEG